MALTNNTLPSQTPTRAVPQDALLSFGSAQTITSTGYMPGNGTTAYLDLFPGRGDYYWVTDISALDVGSGDETYLVALLGSNDSAFGNGNCELLGAFDFAAVAASRLVPTICPISDTVPLTGLGSTRIIRPFVTQFSKWVFRYVKMRLILAGTTPSITLSSWVTPDLD